MSSDSVLIQSLTASPRPSGVAWLKPLQQASFDRLRELGLPTRKSEDWKYTDITTMNDKAFVVAKPGRFEGLKHQLLSVPAPRLVFVNGHYMAEPSELGSQVSFKTFSQLTANEEQRVRALLSPGPGDGVAALQQALSGDGGFIVVPAETSVAVPIHIVHISSPDGPAPTISAPTLVVVASHGSRATLVEAYGHVEKGLYWTNSRTIVALEERASLHHYKIQNEGADGVHTGHCQVLQAKDSAYESFSFAAGAKLGRNELHVTLNGANASVTMNGLYLVREGRLLDNHTVVDHAVPHARSSQYYKGILAENSRAVFNGKIIVRRDAQKTDSSQLNRNLLLGPKAEIDTRPQLQIDADDVKCSHGASIGRPNPEEMFYLESRGLSSKQAAHLLCVGFAEDLISKLQDGRARHEIQNILAEVFAQMKVVAT
ncbi:MAG TPA: Fe-S cluster assembly protein SufD [Bdellovibrionales bacterium]|nr:Fe-S cluster assembly protein SufD [Bdellovibrionales bacterium]